MYIYVIIYFLVFTITLLICKKLRLKVKEMPSLAIDKCGLFFESLTKHRLKLNGASVLTIGNNVYLKRFGKMVCLNNVDKVFEYKDCIYFQSLGKVRIKFNCENIYRYFLIDIESENVDMKNFKKSALNDIKNHIFDLKNAKILKKYIKTIKNIFKINLHEDEIRIKQNKFRLSFVVKYFSKGQKKRVKVN